MRKEVREYRYWVNRSFVCTNKGRRIYFDPGNCKAIRQMKKIMKIFFVMCFGYQAYAQDTTKILDSLNLPQVDMQLMNDAKMSWMGAYTGKTDNKLFPGLMFVGSG